MRCLLALPLAAALLAQEPGDAAPKVPALKKLALDAKAPLREREQAAAALAADKEGGLFLLGLAGQEKLPRELEGAVSGAIFRNPDLGVRGLATQYFKRPAKDGAAFPPIADLVKMKGNAANGKKVFFADSAACGKCHKFGDEGGDVGPPLTEIRGKLSRPEVFDAILNPAAVISFGYEGWLLVTRDDEVFSGIILAEGEEVILKESSGAERAVPAKSIKVRKQLTSSLMPDNISLGLSVQDLVDLAEFLLEEPK